MPQQSPIEYAQQHRDSFLNSLIELLRIPSVSTLPEHAADMEHASRWLTQRLERIGIAAEIIVDNGHPLVYGEWLGAGNAPTVLVYGHYDVQPVDPEHLWRSAPFEPTVNNGNIYARGASDDKGQTLTFLNAVESLMHSDGKLPVNLKFLIEGEEECGGATIKRYVSQQPERLKADFAQVADSGMFATGIPTIETGLRGIVYAEVHARGASHDLHSGIYGGVAPNPLNALGHIIASLKDCEGWVKIPGFYDAVRMPDEVVLASWSLLPHDEQELIRELGVTSLTGEKGYSALERIWARPTLDVHGIVGGFTGEGAKTVIPAEAVAKISMRLVPGQTADDIFTKFACYVATLAPPAVTLETRLIHGDDPVVIPTENVLVESAQRALESTFGRSAVLSRSGGSIPIVGAFTQALGLPTLLMGWGLPDDNLHAPNEKFSLDNYFRGTEATIRLWQILGEKHLE